MVAAAYECPTSCRIAGGIDDPCAPNDDRICVLQAALGIATTYNTDFVEIFAQDGQVTDFYDIILAATIAMGGTPRLPPTPTPTPNPNPPPPPHPDPTACADCHFCHRRDPQQLYRQLDCRGRRRRLQAGRIEEQLIHELRERVSGSGRR